MKRPTKRAKRTDEMDIIELEAVHEYCKDAHPSNVPEDIHEAWWEIDPKTGTAGWIAGHIF